MQQYVGAWHQRAAIARRLKMWLRVHCVCDVTLWRALCGHIACVHKLVPGVIIYCVDVCFVILCWCLTDTYRHSACYVGLIYIYIYI